MTDLELKIPATYKGKIEILSLGASEASPCRIWVVDPAGSRLDAQGADLFDALGALRSQLEREGVLLQCNGSRVDVYPSAAQRQQTNGRKAYVLAYPRSSKGAESVDIFEAAPIGSTLGTVDEQRRWFDTWRSTPFAD